MKNLIILCLTLYFTSVTSWKFFHNGRLNGGNLVKPYNSKLKTESGSRWFTQSLDHFDVGNLQTWRQKYYINDEFFDQNNRTVAFLFIGGESEATEAWMTNGDWYEYAQQNNAILFQLEHRFYGTSRPTKDLSVENLRYLTSQQALADLAVFVESMNEKYNLSKDVKWIAFGGSYAGSLAAWLRLKYPHLIHGAVSTSGPLLAVADFQDYYKVVADDLRNIDENCLSAVEAGTAQIESLLQDTEGRNTLTSLFQLCEPLEEAIDNADDIANFFATLAANFAGIAQYNGISRGLNLNSVCNIMTNDSNQEITRLANFNSLLLELSYESCLDYKYSEMIDFIKKENWDSDGMRQWIFQTCNEFGFYQTSTKVPQVFGDRFPIEFAIKQCTDIFGSQFNETYLNRAIERTNVFYGALDIEVSNVVFVHGSVDPWHALGITSTISEKAPAVYIEGTAHCANIYPSSAKDSPQLTAARAQIGQLIQSWLNL